MDCKKGFVNITLTAKNDDAGRRLDRILRKALEHVPLSALHRLLRKGQVLVNGKTGRGDMRIPEGAVIELPLPEEEAPAGPGKSAYRKQNKPDILCEGGGLLILNKPSGLAVHGGGNSADNLNKRVLEYLKGKLPDSLSFKPGPLNRLDKPASGIVVFALSLEGAQWFSALLREGKIRRYYRAILEGTLQKSEIWEDMLYRDKEARKTFVAGKLTPDILPKKALTYATPIAWGKRNGLPYTFARLEIITGRTHQIRAQAAANGFPLAGDRKYGGKPFMRNGFFLHSSEMEIPPGLPSPIKAPLPENFAMTVKELFGILDQ